MNVSVSARHCTVPESVRIRAIDEVRRLTRYDRGVSAAEVVFDEEAGAPRAEARVQVDGRPVVVAQADGPTFRSALDRLVGRLARRLRRGRTRRTRYRTPAPAVAPASPGDA